MVLCLFAICLVCSSLLAGVYALTKAPIEAAAIKKTNDAIAQVVPSFETVSEEKTVQFEGKSYSYYEVSSENQVIAYAITVASNGFGGPIKVMVGITADGIIYNSSVLSHSETPGLGAKCTESAFLDQFKGFNPVEKQLIVKKDGGDVDAITASTITSRAFSAALSLAVNVQKAIVAEGTSEVEPEAEAEVESDKVEE